MAKQNDTVSCVIPFAGFYYSDHDAEFDRALEMMVSDESGCHPVHPDITMRLFDRIDWRMAHVSYARQFALDWCEHFGIKGAEFEELNSPREYNFTTDRIFVRIPESEIARIHAETAPAVLCDVAREEFTSRSGFFSFYSNDPESWGELAEWDHNQRYALLIAYARQREPEFEEFSLCEDYSGNGMIDNWILNTPKAIRTANAAYRLHQRAERESMARWRKSMPEGLSALRERSERG